MNATRTNAEGQTNYSRVRRLLKPTTFMTRFGREFLHRSGQSTRVTIKASLSRVDLTIGEGRRVSHMSLTLREARRLSRLLSLKADMAEAFHAEYRRRTRTV